MDIDTPEVGDLVEWGDAVYSKVDGRIIVPKPRGKIVGIYKDGAVSVKTETSTFRYKLRKGEFFILSKDG